MCTILVFNRVIPDIPVLIAANRDEIYNRPSSGAVVLQQEPRIVGGRDEIGGGTWMGVTEHGFLPELPIIEGIPQQTGLCSLVEPL